MIDVMLVDDERLVRLGYGLILRKDPALQVTAEASNGREAIEMLQQLAEAHRPLPHVLLMDVRMPVMDGVDATRIIVARFPQCRVLILTTYDQDDYAFGALNAGASGFLLKDASSAQLHAAIHAVSDGDAVLTPRITREVIEHGVPRVATGERQQALRERFGALTPREWQVARLVADGLSNKEIAERLVVEPASARRAISRMLTKLGLRDRVQLAVRWYQAGL
jgi:DNA-binding NarL/FixJ family response regulator